MSPEFRAPIVNAENMNGNSIMKIQASIEADPTGRLARLQNITREFYANASVIAEGIDTREKTTRSPNKDAATAAMLLSNACILGAKTAQF